MATIHPAHAPHELTQSMFNYGLMFGGQAPERRAADLAEICSVRVQELFDDIPSAIHQAGEDVAPIRAATIAALDRVDMSMIQPGDSVNVLCSEHGFAMMGGDAYAEILRTIYDVVTERTGANLKLALSSAATRLEQFEILPKYGLVEYYGGKYFAFGPFDKGIPIDTEIGRLYGVASAYSAKWIIHAVYDDPREMHFHRFTGRTLKPFAMSYARMETRSVFHNNFPTSSASIVSRAIYESPFVQDKWAFAVALKTSPAGTVGVESDNDLVAMDRRMTRDVLRAYGKMLTLLRTVKKCVMVADDCRWLLYQHAGGVTACNLFEGAMDHLDLDYRSVRPPKGEAYSSMAHGPTNVVLVNSVWKNPQYYPLSPVCVTADPAIAEDLRATHPTGVEVHTGDTMEEALEIAKRLAGTDRVLVFDGTYGAINMSRPLAEDLIAAAPEVARRVDEELLPKWLRQRNLSPEMQPA
ncbi:hypothetical protein ACIGO9_20495 [Nocardia asteroides]|uniref:hypothetical protein n=1 Tax=Nocardia asteroides TaxID=1824 RepID=UPI0037C83D24